MRYLLSALLVAASLATGGLALAARNPVAPVEAARVLELIVVEVESCRACGLLRDHVMPAYQTTTNAKRAPMRVVHLDSIERSNVRLLAPLETLPTLLLVADGVEIDRLSGYMAPETMLQLLHQMIERAG